MLQPDLADCHFSPELTETFNRYYLYQVSWYYFKWIWSVLYSLLLMVFLRTPTDQDILKYVENTLLSMLVRVSKDCMAEEYVLEVKDCKLRLTGGYELRQMRLVYRKMHRKDQSVTYQIISFFRNDEPLEDHQQIFATIFLYHIVSLHTKCHLHANGLTRHILRNNIAALKESSYVSLPLHRSLLHSSYSPLQRDPMANSVSKALGYILPVLQDSVVEETKNVSSMKGHRYAQRWQRLDFPKKIYQSRLALKRCVERHGISDRLVTPLFTSTIVHTVEHYSMYKYGLFR